MATKLAKYYSDELADWNNTIAFYNNEMFEFRNKLEEVIRRNSIVDIAKKVERHQSRLDYSMNTFYKLQKELMQQQTALKTDHNLVDDAAINTEIEIRQAALRTGMQTAEKEYIDIKFDCYNFLSGTLKKK